MNNLVDEIEKVKTKSLVLHAVAFVAIWLVLVFYLFVK